MNEAATIPGRPKAQVPSFFEDVYDALFVTDATGAVRNANGRAEHLTGYTRDELRTMNVADLIAGFKPSLLQGLASQLKTGRFTVVEGQGRRKDGSRIDAELAIGRVASPEGGFLFSVRRVDARAGTEPSQQDLTYRHVFQGLYDAIIVADLKGQVVDENRRAREFFQYGEQEMAQRRVEDLISGLDSKVLAQLGRDMSGGRPAVIDAYCVRKDKTTFPSEIALSGIRVRDAGLIVLAVRSTERRRRMQEMLRTEHNALQNAAAGIAITDTDGKLKYANRAFLHLWGHTMLKDMGGRGMRDIWEEKDRAAEMVTKAFAGVAWHGELTSSGLNGRTFHVQASAAANRDSRDRIAGLVFSFIDITDRKRAEEAIRREAEAQMKKAREQEDFSGMLNILSIPDVVQLIDATRKNGTLFVYGPDGATRAEIAFSGGQVVRAVCGAVTGEAGFYDALRQGGTAFMFKQGVPAGRDETIGQGTMGLLLEGSRVLDEALDRESEAVRNSEPAEATPGGPA